MRLLQQWKQSDGLLAYSKYSYKYYHNVTTKINYYWVTDVTTCAIIISVCSCQCFIPFQITQNWLWMPTIAIIRVPCTHELPTKIFTYHTIDTIHTNSILSTPQIHLFDNPSRTNSFINIPMLSKSFVGCVQCRCPCSNALRILTT